MVIKRNLTLPKLYESLALRYQFMESELAMLGQANLRFDEIDLTWFLHFSEYSMLTACMIKQNKVVDYQCECDHFTNRGHCVHLFKLIDLVLKKKLIKLYPSKIKQRRTSMAAKVADVVDIMPATVLAEFVKKYAVNVEEISLLLITSSLRYESLEDLTGKCDLHFEHLLAKYSYKVKSRAKYDQLLRHFNIVFLDIRNLISEKDFQVASILYIQVLKSLFPTFYQIANTDQRFKYELEAFEQHITLFDFTAISPLLKEEIKQGIASTLKQDWYPGTHSDGGFYLLPPSYLPSKKDIKTHLEHVYKLDPQRFQYPVLALIANIYGITLTGNGFHWKTEDWLVCLNIAEKFPNKRVLNSILFDMINQCIIQECKEEAYILFFQRIDSTSLTIDSMKPMVRFSNRNKSSRLISSFPKSYRVQFITCLKSELESFSDYTFYAEISKLWEMNSELHELIDWEDPISVFGLIGGLSDTFITNHKTEFYTVVSLFLTHFFGEQNKTIFREFMSNLKKVIDPLFYDELVHFIQKEFSEREDILRPKGMSDLRVEFFKP